MKKVLFSILAVIMIISLFTFSASAETTATTFEEVYMGEYDSGIHTGECCIIFGTVSDTNAEYGVIITDSEGKSYKFLGQYIGEEGKFGIAIYNMPDGEYVANVYTGAGEERVIANAIFFTKGDTSPTFVISSATASAGDTDVEITVSLKNNPGIASMNLVVTYADGLTLTNITYNTSIGGTSQLPQKNDSPFILNWVSGQDAEGDWVFATLKFSVASTVDAGEYNISMTYDPNNVYNIMEDNVEFAVKNGKIIVE